MALVRRRRARTNGCSTHRGATRPRTLDCNRTWYRRQGTPSRGRSDGSSDGSDASTSAASARRRLSVNLAHGRVEVRRIGSALGRPESLRHQACQLFRSAQSANLLHGRSSGAVATASVYGVCRCNGLTHSRQSERPGASHTDTGDERLQNAEQRTRSTAKPVSPSDHIARLASVVGVCDQVRR